MGKALKKVEAFGAAGAAKLESSGLTVEQGAALGMYETASAAALDKSFEAVPALVLPYFTPEGKPMKAHPKWPDFYRLRYLIEGKAGTFAEAAGEKSQRYSQAPGTGVCAYFPQLVDWAALRDDPSEPVLITEGELKAAKATAEGFPTIGLGGVYNFRAARQGLFFLPELEMFKWARRKVSIVYDSDYLEKPDICAAINVLAEELSERGALVDLVTLPPLDEENKTGLDDFLVARGDEALIALLRMAEPIAITRELWAMNEQIVYIENPGHVVDQATLQRISPANFTGHSRWATHGIPERVVRPDGSVSYKKVSAGKAWIGWPLRKAAGREVYEPGGERFVEGDFNKWEGWGCQPKKGDIKPWLKLIEFLFDGAEKEAVKWFLDWCAYPLQNPGSKMFSAVAVHGRQTGTGKSLIGYTLGRIYGKNFTKIENKHLGETWWAENRQFVLGDEITSGDKRVESDGMKTLITQEEISINVKFIPQFFIRDCINYYFTSNHADAFFLEDKDRRYFIHEVQAEAPLPQAFYDEYDKWKSGEGPAALFHWLMERDLTGFNPKAPAFQTAARNRMVMAGKSDLALWVAELVENPETKLVMGKMRHARDLFTSAELLEMYKNDAGEQGGRVTKNGMSRALQAAGINLAYKGNPIAAAGTQGRYFMVRNADRWRKAPLKDLAKNITSPMVRD